MKPRHLILLSLWLFILFQYVHYYPQLPPIVASHFDGAGRPNGWSPKGAFFVIYVVLAVIITAAFFWLPLILRRMPASLINLPNREYWLAPQRKDQAMEMLADEMGWFGDAVLTVMMASIQLALNANLPGTAGFQSSLMWVLLAAFVLFAVLWLLHLYRRFARPA